MQLLDSLNGFSGRTSLRSLTHSLAKYETLSFKIECMGTPELYESDDIDSL